MCFFNENAIALSMDNEIGQRLAQLSREKNIVLMKAEKSTGFAYQPLPKPTECVVTTILDGAEIGCFPDFYAALGEDRPERFISL
ncbi:hypothetical protein SAMN06265348_111189 [Pedobacter westerhofensis]|uniref:Uncharacterized protein n=2 Tax=Pedobacter westerhofensis TaxID=425512 RepID=A0A521FF97_9SPHI|nr:hypothetical protein SAMN06265348_111189 [Pedobacter westerhofensis]